MRLSSFIDCSPTGREGGQKASELLTAREVMS